MRRRNLCHTLFMETGREKRLDWLLVGVKLKSIQQRVVYNVILRGNYRNQRIILRAMQLLNLCS